MKTNPLRKRLAYWSAGVALAVLVGTSGCLAVAVGAGAGSAVAYVRGELAANVSSDFDLTVKAANQAVQQLGFAKVSEHRDALLDIIVARNAADKKIEIRLENQGKNLSKIRIRVGVFGNEALSIAILDKIKANL